MINILIIKSNNDTIGYDYEISTFKKYETNPILKGYSNEKEFFDIAKNAEVILFSSTKFDKQTLEQLPKLKVLARYGIGLDNVDINAATNLGVYVCNTPSYGCYDVAQHTISLLLAVNQSIPGFDRNVRTGNWSTTSMRPARRLRDKILGILGFGRISRYVAKMAKGFGMEVWATDPYVEIEDFLVADVKKVSLDELLASCDYISINAPLTKSTYHIIDINALKLMKPSAILINTSRGGLVNTDALIYALENNLITGAGLDVFEDEPLKPDSKLLTFSNVVMTPHIAWFSDEAMVDLHKEITDNVLGYLQNGVPNNAVNAPQITEHKFNKNKSEAYI